jgi:hypothetical protein
LYDFQGLFRIPPMGRHDDEQVDIGIFAGRTIGVGAEEDDPFRVEGLGNAVCIILNALSRDHGDAIIPVIPRYNRACPALPRPAGGSPF